MPRTLRTGESTHLGRESDMRSRPIRSRSTPTDLGCEPYAQALGRDLVRHVVAALLLGLLAALVLARLPGLAPGGRYLPVAATGLAAGALLLLALHGRLRATHPHARFGAANRITLARGTLIALLGGFAVVADAAAPLAWAAVALATLAASLDALDGRYARREGLASRYGARFDMETDALLILVLALLAWRWDRAGVWVLASGLMRYAFVLAGRVWPALAAELAPSRRRQAVCVTQVVVLIAVLAPWWPAPVAMALAAAGLAALCYSFGVDVLELARRHRSTAGVAA